MKILFRPSEVYKLMTNPRGKNQDENLPHLSETTKTHLRSKMIEIKYNRFEEVTNKYMKKGIEVEEESITNYSIIKGKFFENNKIRKTNDYFTGEIDLKWDDDATIITDIKSSYNIHSFFKNEEGMKPANVYQGLAYMDLYPECQEYKIANILTDNTDEAILSALYYESYQWADGSTPAWREIEIIKEHLYTQERFDNMIKMRGIDLSEEKAAARYESFVEIPLEDRLIEHTFERDEETIKAIKERIDLCREYLHLKYGL